MSHLFFYFDSIEDLRPNSTFRRMVFNQANERRAIIKKCMEQHIFNVINAWKKTIYSFYKVIQTVVYMSNNQELPIIIQNIVFKFIG
jgi:hypothetical protein